jgi:hypothetical protein
VISSGFQLQYPARRNCQSGNPLHADDLLAVVRMPGRDHQFYFRGDRRRCARQFEWRLAEISNSHVRGCCFRNRWNCLQPAAFNFDRDVVRQGGFATTAEKQEKKESDRDGRFIHRIQDTGYRIQDTGYRSSGVQEFRSSGVQEFRSSEWAGAALPTSPDY